MPVRSVVPGSVAGLNCKLGGRRRPTAAVLTKERQKPEPEHIERGEQGRDEAEKPVPPTATRAGIGLPKDFVLAEKAGKGRNASDGNRARCHGPKRPRDFLPKSAHLAHILFPAEGVHYRTGREEQQTFEEGVGHQMKDARRVG